MRKCRIVIIVGAVFLMIGQLSIITYSDLGSTKNIGNYFGLVTGLCIIISMILSNRHEKKQQYQH